MAESHYPSFDERIARVQKLHAAGEVFLAQDGPRKPVKRPRKPRLSGWWLQPLAMVLAGALLFKGALFAQLGSEIYAARVEKLQQGSAIDRVAAWVLYADGATQKIGKALHPLVY